MINIKKFDAVADTIKNVLQQEALKGDQHKIDKNKNNKIDAHDFKILRGEKPEVKKEEVEKVDETSHNNPFDLKNYKSQLPTKPGEKAGFDSKKISTGTVYNRKPVKDEPMKKEEVEQVDEAGQGDFLDEPSAQTRERHRLLSQPTTKKVTQDILKDKIKDRIGKNPFYPHDKSIHAKKPKLPEEVEQIDELSKSTLGSYVKSAARDVGASRSLGADFKNKAEKSRKPSTKAASSRLSDRFNAVAQKRHAGIGKAVERLTKEEVELDEANTEKKQEFLARQQRLAAAHSETQKDPKRLARLMKIPGYADAMKLAQKTTQKEEVEQMDERTLTKGETAEKERIVKGMKKNLAGFKARYGERAKSVMYATATKSAKNEEKKK